MTNLFLARLFDWGQSPRGSVARGNAILQALRVPWILRRKLDPLREMTSLEQRLNLWHLASQPFAYGVPGDAVELGCFEGKTAVIFARVLEELAPERQLHVYDRFAIGYHLDGQDIEQVLLANFRSASTRLPAIHQGDFAVTIPAQLPDRIAFAHFDCGYGGDVEQHRRTLLRLLEHVYPRMPRGAVGVLMDYHDPATCSGDDFNPGVAPAAREFFADKAEKVSSLYAGEYAHGYFRKC